MFMRVWVWEVSACVWYHSYTNRKNADQQVEGVSATLAHSPEQ